jgi:hypothetical protein
MKIVICARDEKWVRADLLYEGEIANLYHVALDISVSLKENFVRAAEYVLDNYPEFSHVQIISDLNTQLKGGPQPDAESGGGTTPPTEGLTNNKTMIYCLYNETKIIQTEN